MIQQQTKLKVTDNSGAKTVKCIKVLGGFKKKFSYVGDVIIVSIKKLRNKSKLTAKVKKGQVFKALIVRTKKKTIKKDGSAVFFKHNAVSLITKQGQPLGSRLIGPVSKELSRGKFTKFANISMGLV